jgi:uncharacterized membrane protein
MSLIERSVEIARPVPDVFAYMDDIDRETEWQSNLLAARQEPVGPVGVGTVKRYTIAFLKKEIENIYRVTDYEMYVRVALESLPESAVQAQAEIRWEPVGSGTRVTMSIDAAPGSALKLIPKAVLEKTSIKELEKMLDALRLNLESGR